MIDLECPSCGRVGSVPNDKANDRLVCKKCHMVFHLTPTGRTVVGEPPLASKEKGKSQIMKSPVLAGKAATHAHKIPGREVLADPKEFFGLDRQKGLVGVLAVCVLGLGGVIMWAMAGKDDLALRSQSMAEAFIKDDQATVKRFAWSFGAEGAPAWYDAVRAQIADLKKTSAASSVLSSVFVIEENHAKQKGSAVLSFAPAAGTSRDQTLAGAGSPLGGLGGGLGGMPGDPAVKQVLTYWVLDRGYWRLDVPKTATVAPAAVPTNPTPKAPRAAAMR